jgi:hypothetical protein
MSENSIPTNPAANLGRPRQYVRAEEQFDDHAGRGLLKPGERPSDS